MDLPFNRDLGAQIECLETILSGSEILTSILVRAAALGLPDWYLGAGCIAQTVWNIAHGFELNFGIRDYDLVYFDPVDLTYEGENARIEAAHQLFGGLKAPIEIRNQARVHLWYERHFGYHIAPYKSAEHAIATWPTTATAIGVRQESGGTRKIFAPFGLNDLFGLVVRPNRVQITREIYCEKVERWTAVWPRLRVIAWE
jgi:uncharacterized protein